MDNVITDIYDLLYRLGVTPNYIGFLYTAYAVKLCAERQERLFSVTKQVYPEVAKKYHTNWKAVERDIRTVVNIIWTKNRALLGETVHRPIFERPKTAQFLAMLSYGHVEMR